MSEGKKTDDQTDESKKSEFRDKLRKAGRLVPAKPKTKPKGQFILIETDGKPLSEIVIEERK